MHATSAQDTPGTAASPLLPPEVRARFPGAQEKIYLDIALKGLIPRETAEAAHAHVEENVHASGSKDAQRAAVERCRELLAEIIGAGADEVAITKNVSEGLNLFASSLPWQPGDNVVLCPELEHPNNVFVWYNLRKLQGIEVRALPPADGRIPVDAFAAVIDHRTRLLPAVCGALEIRLRAKIGRCTTPPASRYS